jgi:hypothetical protein
MGAAYYRLTKSVEVVEVVEVVEEAVRKKSRL